MVFEQYCSRSIPCSDILIEIELYGLISRMALVGRSQKEAKVKNQKTREKCVLRDDSHLDTCMGDYELKA